MKTNICLLSSLLKERQERDFLSRLRDFEHQFAVHSVQIRKTVILQIRFTTQSSFYSPEIIWTQFIWIIRLWITLAARRKRFPTLTILALLSSRAETIRIISFWITFTSKWETLALDTLITSTATGVGIISLWITVTAWREGGLTCAILANISRGTETVWILRVGVTVASQWKTSTLNTFCSCRTARVGIISSGVTLRENIFQISKLLTCFCYKIVLK